MTQGDHYLKALWTEVIELGIEARGLEEQLQEYRERLTALEARVPRDDLQTAAGGAFKAQQSMCLCDRDCSCL